eukprot:TRINITY_DN3755_c0_g1_i3.p1 TRINITY_DN3755_c0_g1~~TRINITY_DN3755_c0_g1_i3.p1  ORF type:complete len:117 (-),score=23.00 TRINITY_DN3755_c0_g1_i3:731-1081(-)
MSIDGNSAYSPQLSTSPVPTRKVSITKTSGFLVNRRHSETLLLLQQCLKEAEVFFQSADENTLMCRFNRDDACDFKIMLTSVLDNSSYVVKFQRLSEDITNFDAFFDYAQKALKTS